MDSNQSLWGGLTAAEYLQLYSTSQLLAACGNLLLRSTQKRNKSLLISAIVASSQAEQNHVRVALQLVQPAGRRPFPTDSPPRQCRRLEMSISEPQQPLFPLQRVDRNDNTNSSHHPPTPIYPFVSGTRYSPQSSSVERQSSPNDEINSDVVDDLPFNEGDNGFLRAPTHEIVQQCISQFIHRTGNEALSTVICAACAREVALSSSKIMPLGSIPNSIRLRPSRPHPAHVLSNGLLLEPSAIHNEEKVAICLDCERALSRNKTPPLSIANNMWIGEIPWVLKVLTLPERLLIAKYYPVAYIVKLYPKDQKSRYWGTDMQSGLKGNVSTYRLDANEIKHMIDGVVLPPPAAILSSVIGVTFVGPDNLPRSQMPHMFHVRRCRVKAALEWLKENNPLYREIVISTENLLQLPEDGVPRELIISAKHSTDTGSLAREQEGYVPVDDEDHHGKFYYWYYYFSLDRDDLYMKKHKMLYTPANHTPKIYQWTVSRQPLHPSYTH